MTLAPSPSLGLLHDLDTREGCIQYALEATTDYKERMFLVVEAWVNGKHGPLEDLAEAVGKSVKTLRNHYIAPLRKEGRVPASNFSRTNPGRPKAGAAVENDEPIDVEVEVIAPSPSPEEIRAKLRAKQTPTPDTANVRRPDERHGPGPIPDDLWGNTDAEHWQHIQDCDEPDSYKQAQHLLTQFSRLLRGASGKGWSEEAFSALRDDLEGYARTCAANSDNYRERGFEVAQETWASLEGPVLRGEGGSGLPSLPSN